MSSQTKLLLRSSTSLSSVGNIINRFASSCCISSSSSASSAASCIKGGTQLLVRKDQHFRSIVPTATRFVSSSSSSSSRTSTRICTFSSPSLSSSSSSLTTSRLVGSRSPSIATTTTTLCQRHNFSTIVKKRKTRYRPLYKKFLYFNKNIQNRKSIYSFRRKKWLKFISFLSRESRRYKNKPYTINQYYVPRFASRGNSFSKDYKNNLQDKRKFNIFYGSNLKKKQLQKLMTHIIHSAKSTSNASTGPKKDFSQKLLEIMESRLDSVLYRSHFASSMRNAQQMIYHKMIRVNHKVITKQSYICQQGDFIEVNPKHAKLVQTNIQKLTQLPLLEDKHRNLWFWRIPPDYLIIKYKTMQIIFGDISHYNFSTHFPFWLNTNVVLNKYYKY